MSTAACANRVLSPVSGTLALKSVRSFTKLIYAWAWRFSLAKAGAYNLQQAVASTWSPWVTNPNGEKYGTSGPVLEMFGIDTKVVPVRCTFRGTWPPLQADTCI